MVTAVKRANIENYSIHVVELAGKKYLIAYFEYTGTDPEADFATVAEDPTTRDKWWPLTDDCQAVIPGTPDGQQGLPAEIVMHLP